MYSRWILDPVVESASEVWHFVSVDVESLCEGFHEDHVGVEGGPVQVSLEVVKLIGFDDGPLSCLVVQEGGSCC